MTPLSLFLGPAILTLPSLVMALSLTQPFSLCQILFRLDCNIHTGLIPQWCKPLDRPIAPVTHRLTFWRTSPGLGPSHSWSKLLLIILSSFLTCRPMLNCMTFLWPSFNEVICAVLIDQEKYHTNEVGRKIRTTVGLQLLLVEARHNLFLLSCPSW